MSVVDRLNQDMKDAMRAKETLKLSVIRMLKAALKNEEISVGKPLSEEQELNVLSRELKQRRDSLTEFEKAGRKDLVEKTLAEIEIVKNYLPAELSEDELRAIIREVIESTGAQSRKDIGKVMGVLMARVKGRADGKLVNRLVTEMLS